MSREVVIVLVVAACKAGAPPAQTFAEAVAILCGAEQPEIRRGATAVQRADDTAAWIDREITNARARAMLAAMNEARDRRRSVLDAAKEVGITDCQPLRVFGAALFAAVDVPVLDGAEAATVELDQELVIVAVTPRAVIVDGHPVVVVRDGAIAEPDALESYLAQARSQADAGIGRVTLAIDRALSLATVMRVLDALHHAGTQEVEVVAAVGPRGEPRTIPVRMPRAATGDTVVTALLIDNRTVASELAGRLAASGADDGRSFHVVIGEPPPSVATLVEALAALRAAPDGMRRFDPVVLGTMPPPPAPIPAPPP